MPVIKELQDIVDQLGGYDREYQESAIRKLMGVLVIAEEDAGDSHLSEEERLDAKNERMLARYEQQYGKEAGAALRAKAEEIKRQNKQT